MIPLRDNVPNQKPPIVTVGLIFLNILIFSFQTSMEYSERPWRGDLVILAGGIIPGTLGDTERYDEALLDYRDQIRFREEVKLSFAFQQRLINEKEYALQRADRLAQIDEDFQWLISNLPILGWLTLLSSIFLHGGILHLAFNMWFLWIFGDNVEDRTGHFRFLLFYLLTGVGAGLAHIFFAGDSMVPTIGASGAIGGVLGAYVLLYPGARILTLIPIIFFLFLREVPAWFFLGIWFLVEWFAAQGSQFAEDPNVGGVAHWAHVGGFLAGVLLIFLFAREGGGRKRRPSVVYRIE